MSEHTKGPWFFDGDEITANCVRIPLVGVSLPMTDGPWMDEARANARRIVLAVNCHDDLLAALKTMFDRWETDSKGTDRVIWDTAVAAIAKASP